MELTERKRRNLRTSISIRIEHRPQVAYKIVIGTKSSSWCSVPGNNGAAKGEAKAAAESGDDEDSCPLLVSDDEDLPPLVHLTTSHRAAQPAQQAQQTSAPRGMGIALPGRHSQGALLHLTSQVVQLYASPVWLHNKVDCVC